MTTVTISSKAARRLAGGHVWVFAGEVENAAASAAGDVVRVAGPGGRILGTAHYSSSSTIALRLLSRTEEPVAEGFFEQRLAAALEHRRRVVRDSEACRLCHAEGDLLPGLIVDRYAGYLVVQTLTQGMDRAWKEIAGVLAGLVTPQGILLRNDAPRRQRESLAADVRVVHGEIPPAVGFRMNGLRFEADLVHGQKTGVFLDQRENYVAAAGYARGRALDCFTCTGGFALHLAPRCDSVEAVDSSARALETARHNAVLNDRTAIQFREADVFDLLRGYSLAGRRFDTIVLDPPAFAKSRGAVGQALRAYREINFHALRMLNPGGVLVTCSCSHHVGEAMLMGMIKECSTELGRTVRILERRTQSLDHPILAAVPETHYLKCLILQVL